MTLTELRSLSRLYTPKAKINRVSNTNLDLIINQGILDVAALTVCLKVNDTFNVEAETGEYSLSTKVTDFLVPDYPGFWWNDGNQLRQLDAYTLELLSIDFPNWQTTSSGDPQRFSIDGDIVTVHPKPKTAVTDGFKIYYGKLPPTLSSATKHAFSDSTTPFPRLEIFSEAILKYVRWKLSPVINAPEAETKAREDDYYKEILSKKGIFDSRSDMRSKAQMGRINIPESF